MCGKSDKRIRKTVFLMILLVFLSLFAVSCDYRIAFKEPDAVWNGRYVCDGAIQGSSVLLLNSDRSFRYEYDTNSTSASILSFSEGEYRLSELVRREEFDSSGNVNIVYRGTITFISGLDDSTAELDFTGRIASDSGTKYIIIGTKDTLRPLFERVEE